ncbi:uncharacterized protein PADG_11374 [Paracoccidioides brasiliensis Pb18]|uniref:Uncharacterized protein n=1 Tax=Paracoccidioides brasiliensis (strain Pb18) TaxID=502780 RepID=A0A0A0HYU9_PARBD|nr:uncharacterized protein PADG_11374 [Paracoccidioides brasiliensis Pb18]KGM92545.1 hypothetical protein PADG_11374 [Paracoccidioides brasiliensis Pb18]
MPRDHHEILWKQILPPVLAIYIKTLAIFRMEWFLRTSSENHLMRTNVRGIKLLGIVQGDYEKVFKDICIEIEAPKKQFDGVKRPYLQDPLRRSAVDGKDKLDFNECRCIVVMRLMEYYYCFHWG